MNGLAVSYAGRTVLAGGPSGRSGLWSQLQPYLMNSADEGKNTLMILDAWTHSLKPERTIIRPRL